MLGVGVRVGDPGHPLKEPGRVCGQSRGTLVTAGARWWPQAPQGSELQRGLRRCGARPRLRAAPVRARLSRWKADLNLSLRRPRGPAA